MVAVLEKDGRKQKAGRAVLAFGSVALLVQIGVLWLEAAPIWSRGAVESFGWTGALGMAALQMLNFIAWDQNGILLSVARLLLLCWPMAVMMAGLGLARSER